VYNYLGGPEGPGKHRGTVSPDWVVLRGPSWAQIVDLGEIGRGGRLVVGGGCKNFVIFALSLTVFEIWAKS